MINEEFLKEQGIEEAKHEAIISAYNNGTKGLFNAEQLGKEKGLAVKSMMEGYEDATFKALGIAKLDNEKASEHSLRANKEYWTNHFNEEINTLKSSNTELSDKIKSGIKDEDLLNKYSLLEKTLETERGTFKKEKETWESENTKREKLNTYKQLVPKLKEDIDPKYRKFMVDETLNVLLGKEVVEVEGKLLIKGDETNGFTNVQVSEYLNDNLKNIIDEKHTQIGTGQRPAGGVGATVIDISDSDSPQEKDAKIRAYLKAKGIDQVSDQYAKEFKELRTKHVLKK